MLGCAGVAFWLQGYWRRGQATHAAAAHASRPPPPLQAMSGATHPQHFESRVLAPLTQLKHLRWGGRAGQGQRAARAAGTGRRRQLSAAHTQPLPRAGPPPSPLLPAACPTLARPTCLGCRCRCRCCRQTCSRHCRWRCRRACSCRSWTSAAPACWSTGGSCAPRCGRRVQGGQAGSAGRRGAGGRQAAGVPRRALSALPAASPALPRPPLSLPNPTRHPTHPPCQVDKLLIIEAPCIDLAAREGGGTLFRQAAAGFV